MAFPNKLRPTLKFLRELGRWGATLAILTASLVPALAVGAQEGPGDQPDFIEIPMVPGESSLDAALNTCVLADLECSDATAPMEPSIDNALQTCVLENLPCINPVPDAPTPSEPIQLAVPPSRGAFDGTWTGTFSGQVTSRSCQPRTDSGKATVKVAQATDGSVISGQITIDGMQAATTCGGGMVAGSPYRCDVPIPPNTPTGRNVTFRMACQGWSQDVTVTLNSDTTATARLVSRDPDAFWDMTMTLRRA